MYPVIFKKPIQYALLWYTIIRKWYAVAFQRAVENFQLKII